MIAKALRKLAISRDNIPIPPTALGLIQRTISLLKEQRLIQDQFTLPSSHANTHRNHPMRALAVGNLHRMDRVEHPASNDLRPRLIRYRQ